MTFCAAVGIQDGPVGISDTRLISRLRPVRDKALMRFEAMAAEALPGDVPNAAIARLLSGK